MPSATLDMFDIQRFSWHDGPGVRSVVFLSGCNLRCVWCHNPESQSAEPQLLYYDEHCIGCGQCVEVCPHGCHTLAGDGAHRFVREQCMRCGACAQVCYSEALQHSGRRVPVEDIAESVLEDAEFYATSGGGVTLSGGEPLLQAAGCRELLTRLKASGAILNTAVDTAGNVPWEALELVLPVTDYVLFDVKAMSDEVHRRGTGASNALIQANLRRLGHSGVPLIVRIPLIPGFNDNQDELFRITDEVAGFANLVRVDLLPYHDAGQMKYRALGREYSANGLGLLEYERVEALRAQISL